MEKRGLVVICKSLLCGLVVCVQILLENYFPLPAETIFVQYLNIRIFPNTVQISYW